MAIYLNVINMGKELEGTPIDKAVTAMAVHLVKLRGAFHSNESANIDLTLMLTTKEARPAFDGMRMRAYSPEEDTLYIESAVPQQALHSDKAAQYVAALLQDAVDNSAEFFAEKGRHFPTLQWLSALQASYSQPHSH